MKALLFFLLMSLSLQADLYDRNKYHLDFPSEDQPRYDQGRPQAQHANGQQHRILPPQHHRECPCDPGDPECPCEIDDRGNYHRVD
jgi:hypothetical protein